MSWELVDILDPNIICDNDSDRIPIKMIVVKSIHIFKKLDLKLKKINIVIKRKEITIQDSTYKNAVAANIQINTVELIVTKLNFKFCK